MGQRQSAEKLFRTTPLATSKMLSNSGVDRKTVQRMVDSGELMRLSRGLYSMADYIPGPYHSLIEVQLRIPHSVISLLSALRYYEIGTQNPSVVWVTLHHRTRTPGEQETPICVVRATGKAFEEGVQTITIDRIPVRIYTIPKTVVDCFKYRNKIGIDVGIEALRDVLDNRLTSVNELMHYAEVCRVQKIIMPYVESLV